MTIYIKNKLELTSDEQDLAQIIPALNEYYELQQEIQNKIRDLHQEQRNIFEQSCRLSVKHEDEILRIAQEKEEEIGRAGEHFRA